jgi:hypothetical protein
MDNTLIFYIAGDNGTSAEGGFVGMYNEMTYFNNVTEKVEDLVPLIDKWGTKVTHRKYARQENVTLSFLMNGFHNYNSLCSISSINFELFNIYK